MIGIKKILKGLLIREENTLTPKEIEILPGGTAGTKTTLTSSQTSNLTLTLPSTAGTNGQLLQTDGAGNLSFVTAGSTNTTLSNLTAPTAINQDLIFNKSTPILKSADTVSAASESMSVLTGSTITSGSSGNLTLGSGSSVSPSGNVSLTSGSTTSGTNTGSVLIRSGNTGAGVASSGPVTVTTGTSSGTNITGSLTLSTGISTGLAGSGIITMNSGNVTTNTSGTSGQVSISSGTSVAGATGQTGNVSLISGNHASPTSQAGNATIASGTQTGTAFSGTGGATTVTTGNITSATATGTTGATNILSGNTAGSGGATGAVTIRSGNATSTGNSGNVILQTGSVTSGTRGTVRIVDASLATASVGHVWTLTNTTTGAGNWAAPGGGGGILSKVTASNASMGSTVTDEVITGLTFAHASFNGCFIDYRIKKGTLVRNGRILVSTDGTTVAFNDTFVETVLSTVVFEAVVNGANINIRHTNTETGTMTISFEQSRFPV